VGASPTRQTLQPEAIGAVMEETKWLKPSISVSRIGDSASVQAVTRVSAPGETGKEYVVKVHCDEGVAIHVAPDPCAGVREDVGEASVGERIGQPMSRGAPGRSARGRW
jgi:hypothetical protein